jgi:thymidylate synthase
MKYTYEDGTPFTKEEFLKKLKSDKEFNEEFGNKGIDQITNLINDLKTNPDSRRLMVNAWNVGELDQMTLPPCHYGFQVYTRELSDDELIKIVEERVKNHQPFKNEDLPKRAISLMYNCRSQDVPLGTPFNISSYALLLMMIAKQVNMVPDQLIGNLGDCHIYLNQIDAVKEQLNREPYPLPTVEILNAQVDDIAHYEISDFELINYQSHPTIKMPLSN